MNARERIIAAFCHQVPDRTPTDAWWTQEVIKRLLAHFGTRNWNEVLLNLGIEGWYSSSPEIDFSEYRKRTTPRPGGKHGPQAIWIDDRTYEDGWGVRHRMGENDWYEEWVDGPLVRAQDVQDVERCTLPSVNNIVEPKDYAATVKQAQKDGMFVSGVISNPYKTAWALRGMENLLCDYLINREMLEALYDRLYAVYSDMAVRMAKAGVDMIRIIGDIAMQDRIIMGPESWRAVDKGRLAALIARCRSIKPDLFFFIHSDGNVTDLMDDLIEIGFNVINPIQPECMDPVAVKQRWGDKISLYGGVSLQKTLPFGSVKDVREEVERLIKKCGYNGGLVVFPSNNIQPDTSVENIIACFHTARDFNIAALGGKPS